MGYQDWFYRVGLSGLVLSAGMYALNRAADSPSTTALGAGEATSETTLGSPVSTPEGAAVPFIVSSPLNGSRVFTSFVTLVGLGPPGATIAVGANGVTVSDVGNWALSVSLVEGQNDIPVVATLPSGEQSSLVLTVTFDPSGATETTEAAAPSGPSRTTTTRRPTTTTRQTTTTAGEETTTVTEPPPEETTTTTQPEETTTTTQPEETTTTTQPEETTTTQPPPP